jgi:hypothetical protein
MKKLPLIASCFLIGLFCFNAFGQDDGGFYQADVLKSDFTQVNTVAYVNVKALKIADSMGSGNCETNKGSGYCLYELTADVKEVFKGKIVGKILKFYTSPDADYPKERLMGEQVVFLNKNNIAVAKTKQFVTLENSTRKIEFDVIGKLRKIKKSAH